MLRLELGENGKDGNKASMQFGKAHLKARHTPVDGNWVWEGGKCVC